MIFIAPTSNTKDIVIAILFHLIYLSQLCLSLVGFGGFIFTDQDRYIRENERNLFLLAIVGFVMTLGTLPLFLYILSRILVFGIPMKAYITAEVSRVNPLFSLGSWGLGLCLILCNIAFLSLFIERCKQNPKVGTNTYLSKEKAILFLSCQVLFFIVYVGLLIYQRDTIKNLDTIEKHQALRQSLSEVKTLTEQAPQQAAGTVTEQEADAPGSAEEAKRIAEKERVDAKIEAVIKLQAWLDAYKVEKQRAPQDLSKGDRCKFHDLHLTKDNLEGIVNLSNIDEAIDMLVDIETLFLGIEDNPGCALQAANYYNTSFLPVYNEAVKKKKDPNRRIRDIRWLPEEKQPEIDNTCAFEQLPPGLKTNFQNYKETIINASCKDAHKNYNMFIEAGKNKDCPPDVEKKRLEYATFFLSEKNPKCVEY